MLAAALALAITTAMPAHAQARGQDRVPEPPPVLIEWGADATEVVWHEDQMCFCEWRHLPPAPEDHYRTVPGVPVPVRDDFARHTVEGVEDGAF